MDIALHMIGFENAQVRERLRAEQGFETFDNLKSMKEKDICNLADLYTRLTIGDGRFMFCVRRIRHLIGIVHWVQDFGRRVSGTPSLAEFGDDAGAFRAALDVAFNRAEVCKTKRSSLTPPVRLRTQGSSRMNKSGPNGSRRS